MSFLTRTIDFLLDSRLPPKHTPPTRNRIDADISLITYHKSGTGLKSASRPTAFLSPRTRIATSPSSYIAKAQTEAYYEEIDTVPAVSLGLKSDFNTGQWYVVHPVTYWQVRGWSNKVLEDLGLWIEEKCPNTLFEGKARQIKGFREARSESLQEVKKELARREKWGQVGEEEGYTGEWEIIKKNERRDIDNSGDSKDGEVETVPGYTNAALEEAAEAGRKAGEEAKLMDGWQTDY
ncbi:hypothetical protein BDU57DRAFT_526835 [Ampelomyces quisqualis]|uniref:Uncharacterized protein n=1 Tax=Ampelomyces quisqualis TaxID=50730 RepID=A0A6A5QVR6_AMPQU|nr:hypothetical protein BDU57DRAFT_526835 [Ampelomyces quisqualis]